MSSRTKYRRVALAVGYPSGFEDQIVRGAIDFAAEVGHWKFVGGGHRPFQPFDQIDLGAVDGVIGLFFPEQTEALVRAGVVAVNTSTRVADQPLARVGNDDEAIGRMGAEHLLQRGFTQYGFVGLAEAWFSEGRFAGFRQVIEEVAGRQCIFGEVHTSIQSWLKGLPRPIGIMAVNDNIALRLIEAIVELGWRIPEDVAVLGVDNDTWACAMSPVPISSVELDARQVGYRAAQLLDGLMDGQVVPPPRWIAPLGVVTRRSTDIVLAQDALVVDAMRFIRDECGRGLCVEDVLYELGVSRRTLENRMKRAIGQTPQMAIYGAQIERAKKLLLTTESNLGDIGRACGFDRQERFSLIFKRHTGLTPGQFRQRQVTRAAAVLR